MRKMFLLFGILALVGMLFVACSEQQDPTSPEEAAFGKSAPADCELGDEPVIIRGLIGELFDGKKDVKAATEMFTNIERKVCKGNFEGATNTAYDFYVMTYGQLPDKLGSDTPYEDAAELVSMIFAFASNGTAPGIPPAALEPTGGVGVVMPGANDTIWTNNDEAAFVADAGSFEGTDPVVVVLQRLPDPTGFGSPIPGYQAFPEAYDFSASVQLAEGGPGAEFWMCVPDEVPVPFEDLVIGHDLGDGESEVLPRLVEAYPGQVIDCTNAAYQVSVPILGAAGTPGWLMLAGTILEPVVKRILDVQPLSAMYFAGKGLGGRGGSLSPFSPVDGTAFTLDFGINGQGMLTIDEVAVCGQSDSAASCSSPEFPAGTEVWIDAIPNDGFVFDSWTGCETTDGPSCRVTMDADKTVSVTFSTVGPPTTYLLSLAIASGNGQVTSDPTGISCREPFVTGDVCEASFSAGTAVVLSASPDDLYYYGTWTIDGAPSETATCSRGNCAVTMNQAHDVTVSFATDPPDVTLELIVEDGSVVKYGVDVFGADLTCDSSTCNVPLKDGDSVVLEVVSPLGTNTPVWSGVTCGEGGDYPQLQPTCSFTISGNQTVNFDTFPFIG
jgi:hypothetical protein